MNRLIQKVAFGLKYLIIELTVYTAMPSNADFVAQGSQGIPNDAFLMFLLNSSSVDLNIKIALYAKLMLLSLT